MDNLPMANDYVRQLEGFRTRRTSIASFRQGMQAIRHDHMRARNLEEQADVEQVNRAYSDVLFSFRRLRQRGFARRFPRNRRDMWAYYCLPRELVAEHLSVSERTVRRRARRSGFPIWPPSSDADHLMIAVQFWNGLYVMRRISRIPRQSDFITLWFICRYIFNFEYIVSPDAMFLLFCECRGVRRGPILNDDQWQHIVASAENQHRINLYMLVSGAELAGLGI